MDQQTQFSFSHILGPSAVEVASYSPFQHQLHGYGNISNVGTIAGLGTSSVAPPAAHSVTIHDATAPPTGQVAGAPGVASSVVAMGYTHHPPGPVQSYHAVFNNVAVTQVTPQTMMPPTQIQYFYEAPGVNVRTQLHHPHQMLPQQPSQNQVKYSNCSFPLQTVNSSLPVSCNVLTSTGRSAAPSATTNKEMATQRRESVKSKKLRKEGISAKQKRKISRNHGEAYISTAGKLVDAKKYVDQDCKCKSRCISKLATVSDRESVFKQFWAIGDFEQQNIYLTENVVLVRNTRKRRKNPLPNDKNLKTVTRHYNVRLPVSVN